MPYKDGIRTVVCNATNGILNTVIPDPLGGRGGITLDKGEYFDIERVLSKSKIRKFMPELEKMEAKGYIAWADKDTKPTGRFVPKRKFTVPMHGTVVAPKNSFDDKLNALLEKEKKEDAKTLPGDLKRREGGPVNLDTERLDSEREEFKKKIEELENKNKELEEKRIVSSNDNKEPANLDFGEEEITSEDKESGAKVESLDDILNLAKS